MTKNLPGLNMYDISAEMYREYTFPDGSVTRIDNPETLYLKDGDHPEIGGGSHRVIDLDGVAHYIPRGWIHLKWNNKPGLERIQF